MWSTMPNRSALALTLLFGLGAVLAATPESTTAQKDESPRFPARVTDIEGRSIDIQRLARDRNLVVVTLKATWCPVCQKQLLRLKALLPKLKPCKVSFVVLAPGSREELAKIKSRIGFDYPFVADVNLEIAGSLGLDMPRNQIFPCMFQVLPNLQIGWKQLGRNGAYFGDGELKKYFDCTPV
ncbi:MAG: redoxin domain-containing protein [Candidatus Krumholzibacteriia bacterium]